MYRGVLVRLLFSSSEAVPPPGQRQKTSKELEESGPRDRFRTFSHHAVHPRVGEARAGLAPVGSGAAGASGEHTSGCVLEVLRDLEAIQVRFCVLPLLLLLLLLCFVAFRKGDHVMMVMVLAPGTHGANDTAGCCVRVAVHCKKALALCAGGGWMYHSLRLAEGLRALVVYAHIHIYIYTRYEATTNGGFVLSITRQSQYTAE